MIYIFQNYLGDLMQEFRIVHNHQLPQVSPLLRPLTYFGEENGTIGMSWSAILYLNGEINFQSELPRPIPWNSVESDNRYTSRIYFDNAGDNVTLTLYNVTQMSKKP